VKFDTYDYSIYGGLKATVEYISIDAIEDQSSGRRNAISVFVCGRTRTSWGRRRSAGHRAWLLGDGGNPDRQEDVLAYLLKPILKARDTAFSER